MKDSIKMECYIKLLQPRKLKFYSIHIAQKTIKKYSESGELYKGYKFEIL